MSRIDVLASVVLSLSMLLAPGSAAEQDLPAKVSQSGKSVVEKQLRMMGHVLARIEHLGYLILCQIQAIKPLETFQGGFVDRFRSHLDGMFDTISVVNLDDAFSDFHWDSLLTERNERGAPSIADSLLIDRAIQEAAFILEGIDRLRSTTSYASQRTRLHHSVRGSRCCP